MKKIFFKFLYCLAVIILFFLFGSCSKCDITSSPASGITSYSAIVTCNLNCNDKSLIRLRGVCWSSKPNPTFNDNNAIDETGMDTFEIVINGLDCNTKYFVRTFFTNDNGTYYGNEESFTTLDAVLPSITTGPVRNLTLTAADCEGKITSDGGGIITECGFCWNTSPNPTIKNKVTYTNANVYGTFSGPLTDLKQKETYYVRAFATNCKGTGYGNEVSFYHFIPIDTLMITFIKKYQRNYIRKSNNEIDCFNWYDYNYFHSKLSQYEAEIKNDTQFNALISEITKLSVDERSKLFKKALKTHQKTWGELGEISSKGQTEAGQRAQKELAIAVVNLAKQTIQ